MVTLLYFASLRERLDRSSETLALPDGTPTVGDVVEHLRSREGPWAEAFAPGRDWRVAVNRGMAHPATPVKPGDEIAFFPPVTGG